MASIQKITSNKGEGYMIVYYNLAGLRRSKTIYGSRHEAEEWAARLENRKQVRRLKNANGTYIHTPEKVMVSTAFDEYRHSVSSKKAATTARLEKWVFDTFLAYSGNMTLAEIDLKFMERYVTYLSKDKKLSPTSIGMTIRTLKAFFNQQIKYGLMEKNPAVGLILPKVIKKKIRFLTEDEIEAFLEAIDDLNYYDLFVTYLNTGARHIELLPESFTWKDVDIKGRRIRLTGKGSSSYVKINGVVHEILKRRKESGIQFPFPLDYDYLYKKFKKYMKKAKIENITLHDLRRTFAVQLIAKGVDIYQVSKLLRHEDVSTTQKYYADVIDRDQEEAVKKLESLF